MFQLIDQDGVVLCQLNMNFYIQALISYGFYDGVKMRVVWL